MKYIYKYTLKTWWLGKSCQFFWPALGLLPRAANISHLAYQNSGKFFVYILACQNFGMPKFG
jgi:hypothetical protein